MPMVELLFSLFMVYFVVGRSVGRSSFLQSIAQASSRPVSQQLVWHSLLDSLLYQIHLVCVTVK